jgi:hypothetical protein
MKKALLICLTTFVLSFHAGAQVFNHLSLGVGMGVDGIGMEVALPIGSFVDVRAGYSINPGLIGVRLLEVPVPEHPGYTAGGNVNVPLTLRLGNNSGRLLFNFYPIPKADFHITAGVFLGSPRFLRGTLNNMPEDYNTVGLDVDGYLVKAHSGTMEAALCASGIGSEIFAVKPYVGLGYGRAVKEDKRISWSVDLGVQYQGKASLRANGEGLTGRIKQVPISASELEALGKMEQYLAYTSFWPTLQFHLYVRLF